MENNSEKGCRKCIKKGYCAFPYQNMSGAGVYCDYYESNGSGNKHKNEPKKKVCTIQKVKCCNNCEHYTVEPVQPWEDGVEDYYCEIWNKNTHVDNYCIMHEERKNELYDV